MKNKNKDYSSVDWHGIFVEDAESPTGLRWKISCGSRAKAGSVAGSTQTLKKTSRQFFVVRFNKTRWMIHRILWAMRNGEIDASLAIDHIDGNSLNNSADNLRLVSTAVNSRNQKQRGDNSSGVTGVYFMTTGGHAYAVAQWNNLAGERKFKNFSCKKLGKDLAFQKACKYREKILEELNASGAGYSERHGT
jgi:hypothetical protein